MDQEQEIKNLVIARLGVLPEDIGISIGSSGNFNKEEMIAHVKSGDEIGKKITKVEMDFLKGLKQGAHYGKEDHLSNSAWFWINH